METAAYWIKKLELSPHPEGGYYKEIYRTSLSIEVNDDQRNLATSIYFMLDGPNISHFHQLTSDELWYFHAGTATIIHMIDKNGNYHIERLGTRESDLPQLIIPAGTIFAAEVENKTSFTLMGCVVTPGFDFRDFKLFDKKELIELHPQHKEVINKFTLSDQNK